MRAIFTRIVVTGMFILSFCQVTYSQPDYSFKNPTLESAPGTELQTGSVYRFSNVKTGTDALVTVKSMTGGITLDKIDETWTGFTEAFQPFINVAPSSDGYVEFEIKFVVTATNSSQNQLSVPMTCIDIDGTDYGNGKLYEKDLIELKSGGYYDYSATTTKLTVSGSSGWIMGKNTSAVSISGIDTVDKDVMYSVVNANINTVKIRIGAQNTSPTGTEVRYRSVYFKKFKYPFSTLPTGTIVSFAGVLQNNTVDLKWDVKDQENDITYYVEKSADNIHFSAIGNYTAQPGKKSYSFTDAMNVTAASYRLKMVTPTGKTSYSNTVVFYSQPNNKETRVYPTQVNNGQFTVSADAAGNQQTQIKIFDYSGKMVYVKSIQLNAGLNNIRVNDFHASLKGNYIVQVSVDNQPKSNKIIIQ